MDINSLLYYELARNTSHTSVICNTNVMETEPKTYELLVFSVESPGGDI
jgi:hypothetical protein